MLLGFPFSLLKVHYHHQRRAAGVNLASAWSAPVRAQWRSCVDHSRRGDALLWRGLLPRRVQTAFTNGTQGHKEGKVHLNGTILSPAAAGFWLGRVFGRIFFTRKVGNKTRGQLKFFFVCLLIFYSPGGIHGAVITPFLSLPSLSWHGLIFNGKRGFYARIARVASR